jgi:MFS family permease
MAIALGVLNGTLAMTFALYVLFIQEVLGLGAAGFGAVLTAGAAGGVIGSFTATAISKRLGQGPSLFATIVAQVVTLVVTGLTSSPLVVWAMFAIGSFTGMIWNVITVSLRQSLIPDRMLGRVNSVYRLVGWGMMPVGSVLGGVIVAVSEPSLGREWALRAPFLIAAAISLVLFFYAIPRLNSSKIDAARDRAQAATAGDL